MTLWSLGLAMQGYFHLNLKAVARLCNLNFHPLEVVSRYRDPQLQVGENYSYLFSLGAHICKTWCFNTHFVPNDIDLMG